MAAYRNVSAGLEVQPGDAPLRAASRSAFDTAVWVATHDGAALHLLSSIDLDPFALSQLADADQADLRTRNEQELTTLATAARAQGVAKTSVAVPVGSPADALIDDAKKACRDLVVAGTRERGAAARILLGSTSLQLVRRAPVPVWIARSSFGAAPPTVVCAVDPGPLAAHVVAESARIAALARGALHVVHVVDLRAEDVLRAGAADAPYIREHRKARRKKAEDDIPALVHAAAPNANATLHLVDGDANETVVEIAQALKADLLVIGSVSARGFALPFTLGRTAEHVLAHAHTSVLVLKP